MTSYAIPADSYQRATSVSDVQLSVSANILYNIAIIILSLLAIFTTTVAYINTTGQGGNGFYLFILIAVSIFLAIFIIAITYKAIQKASKANQVIVEKKVIVTP